MGAGSSESPTVIVRTDPAASADCANGGSIVLAGIDRNGNLALDDAEVQMRTVVCNPPPASPDPKTVIRLVDEPAGANCAVGGTAVQTGPDTNGNGQLDDGEVVHVDYVCGDRLLTRVVAEPAGANCAAGGVAILAGPDRDHDGVLDDGEVAHTDYACGDVLSQSVTIHSDDEAAALANIAVIGGDLTVSNGSAVTLPNLQRIGGSLLINASLSLGELHLPKLQALGGSLSVEGALQLTALDLPVLAQIGGGIAIEGNPKLQSLASLGSVTLVGARVQIRQNAALASVALSDVTISDAVVISRNDALATLSIAFDERLDQVTIDANPGLATLNMFNVNGSGVLGTLQITNNASLTTASISTAKADEIDLFAAPQLNQLRVKSSALGALHITNTPALVDLQLVSQSILAMQVGDLSIDAPITPSVPFGAGLDIAGSLTLKGTHIKGIQLGRVGGTLRLENNVDLASNIFITDDIGGGIEVIDNPVLERLMFFAQPRVIRGDVIVMGNPKLLGTQLLATADIVLGNVTVDDNASTTDVTLGASLVTGWVHVVNNPRMTDLFMARLATVGDLTVASNAALTTLDASALTSAHDIAIDHTALRHLTMPRLSSATSMDVTDNSALPTCEIQAIFTQIPRASRLQSNNNDAATCP